MIVRACSSGRRSISMENDDDCTAGNGTLIVTPVLATSAAIPAFCVRRSFMSGGAPFLNMFFVSTLGSASQYDRFTGFTWPGCHSQICDVLSSTIHSRTYSASSRPITWVMNSSQVRVRSCGDSAISCAAWRARQRTPMKPMHAASSSSMSARVRWSRVSTASWNEASIILPASKLHTSRCSPVRRFITSDRSAIPAVRFSLSRDCASSSAAST
mmetsp:Transcript_10281/g.23931  ORF Transcript_10281/g.23931 Transcript_10281/m.23931 type:complete len:214 (-) Transcript_10281:93-734(-)